MNEFRMIFIINLLHSICMNICKVQTIVNWIIPTFICDV